MNIAIFAALLLPSLAFSQGAASEDRLKSLEERLSRLEGQPASTSLSAFNPAMGAALDFTAVHDGDDKGNLQFRAAEINIEAPIDPHLKGWIIVNGNDSGVEIEEAALQTTSLPLNTTVRAGRLFASFGRLAHFHDHELPVIDRPRSLNVFVDGEAQADGVETTVLIPTPWYLSATLGAYNKLGAENSRATNDTPRSWNEMTYLGKIATSAEFGGDHTVDFGVSAAWTPKRVMSPDPANTAVTDIEVRNTWRGIGGADMTYRWHPARTGPIRGALWSTEVMVNNERRRDATTGLPTDRVKAFGGFSYVQVDLGRWRPGAMIDLSEDLDTARLITRTYTGFLTFNVTEFQRLRLAYARRSSNISPVAPVNTTVGLQWTGVFGKHVHGYRDR